MENTSKKSRNRQLIIAAIIIIFACLLPAMTDSRLVLHYVIMMCVYICLGQAWNILGGLTDLFSLGNATFYGIGAYAVSVGMNMGGLSFPVCIIIGVLINVAFGFILGLVSGRLSGFFFVMATLAFGQVVKTIALQWSDITGGSNGQSIIRPEIARSTFLYVIVALAVVYTAIFIFVRKSRTGSMLVAIRENTNLAKSLGVNVLKYKTISAIISAVMSSLIGSFICYYVVSVDPTSNLNSSISTMIVMVVIVGGIGTAWGPVIGSSMILLEQVIRGNMGSTYAPLTNIIFGIILIAFMLYCPSGVMGIVRGDKKKKKAPVQPNAAGAAKNSN